MLSPVKNKNEPIKAVETFIQNDLASLKIMNPVTPLKISAISLNQVGGEIGYKIAIVKSTPTMKPIKFTRYCLAYFWIAIVTAIATTTQEIQTTAIMVVDPSSKLAYTKLKENIMVRKPPDTSMKMMNVMAWLKNKPPMVNKVNPETI